MTDAFVVAALRTPVGKFRGALKEVRPDDLAAWVIRKLIEQSKIAPDAVNEVYLGCANQAGEDNRNVARMATLLAGLPVAVPAATTNRLCASGLEAIVQGTRQIRLDEADIVIAGGVESMTRAPWAFAKPSDGFATGKPDVFDTSLGWRFPNSAMEKMFPLEQMGETAENVAEKYRISRVDQDAFALKSHEKAIRAQKENAFTDELIAVEIAQKKGPAVSVSADEQPRSDTTREKLASLKAAFRANGTVTAGNSSTLNDGACALILMSESAVKKYNVRPIARFVASASAGVDPRFMGIGPVPATQACLARAKWSVDSLDAIELNEAFAAQSLACIRELNFDEERVNIRGGAIALGHPLGMSGARIVTTLVHLMRQKKLKRGLATLCVGVGQGVAACFEAV